MKKNERTRRKPLPHVGMRMIKTAVAVFLCLVVYMLRRHRGMPIHATIAAVICMQPYMEGSRTFAVNRIIATVIGAVYGLGALLITERIPKSGELFEYLLIAMGVILVLHTTVWIDKAAAASLASAVFLIITVSYASTGDPFEQVYHRVIDTLIGIGAAVFVNGFHLPKEYHREKLFLVRLENLIPDESSEIPASIQIGMNRLIEDGAKVAVVTWRTPAFLVEKLKDMKIQLPMVVMDGAALYDIQENRYIEKVAIPREQAQLLIDSLRRRGQNYIVTTIVEDSLFLYYERFDNPMEEKNYEKMHKSPYRNYVQGDYHREDAIVYVRVMETCEKVERLEKELSKEPFIRNFRMEKRELPEYEGYTMLYFYDIRASRAGMEEKLRRYVKAKELVHTGTEEELLEPQSEEARPENVIRCIRRLYEPVRFWKKKRQKGERHVSDTDRRG